MGCDALLLEIVEDVGIVSNELREGFEESDLVR